MCNTFFGSMRRDMVADERFAQTAVIYEQVTSRRGSKEDGTYSQKTTARYTMFFVLPSLSFASSMHLTLCLVFVRESATYSWPCANTGRRKSTSAICA